MHVKDEGLSHQTKGEEPKWGIVTYRVRFNLWNTYLCVDDMPTTDLEEAKRRLEQVRTLEGVTLSRIAATRELL